MHISSLPSPYGIGTLGNEAYKFVDFLKQSEQRYWQILPVCPTSFGDSPYQSFSTFAGNPYFIDLDALSEQGFLDKGELNNVSWGDDLSKVDFALLYEKRFPVLRKAFNEFKKRDGLQKYFIEFCSAQSDWLDDYALFMACKEDFDGKAWYEWKTPLRKRESGAIEDFKAKHSEELDFWKFLQFCFFSQWKDLKKYANENDVKIIGDVPIYVAYDSADVWAAPEQFLLDENLTPIDVAGCPPDAFTDDGQLWGNPLYRWDFMEKDKYSWWVKRISSSLKTYDKVRIDHFRGFESYYAIPHGAKNAKIGEWRKGPGMKLFKELEKQLGELSVIAEDLGFLTEEVHELLKESGYPGMKVLQFAFDSRENSDYLPHNYLPHCVVYTGTHDNDTVLGWMKSAPKSDVNFAKKYLRLNSREGYNWGMMKSAWASVGELAIVQMQDILGLDNDARMNTPSTTGCNWMWRALPGQITPEIAQKIKKNMKLYRRCPIDKAKKEAETK